MRENFVWLLSWFTKCCCRYTTFIPNLCKNQDFYSLILFPKLLPSWNHFIYMFSLSAFYDNHHYHTIFISSFKSTVIYYIVIWYCIHSGPEFAGCPDEDGELYEDCTLTEWDRNTINSFYKYTTFSFRYGCCPDGLTRSKGLNYKGCDNATPCKDAKWGCCDDLMNPAHGPDKEGCCLNTDFGMNIILQNEAIMSWSCVCQREVLQYPNDRIYLLGPHPLKWTLSVVQDSHDSLFRLIFASRLLPW